MISWLFYMLLYVKWSVESHFLLSFDRKTKLMELCQVFGKKKKKKKKVDIIENYTNGGIMRKSPPYDFLIISHATLCKMIRRIRFSINFWSPDKIDKLMAVSWQKKVDIIENYTNEKISAFWFSDYFTRYCMQNVP